MNLSAPFLSLDLSSVKGGRFVDEIPTSSLPAHYYNNLRRHFFKFAFNTASNHRASTYPRLTLCLGYLAMFMLIVLVTNYTIRFYRCQLYTIVFGGGDQVSSPKNTSFNLALSSTILNLCTLV